MKLKRIIASILFFTLVIGNMCFPAFAEGTTDRSIIMTPSKDEVKTGETFTVTVSVAHQSDELKFASWDLSYNQTYFDYVSASLASPYTEDSVLVMYRNGNELTPDVYATTGHRLTGDIMVYTFTAKKTAVEDELFDFASNNVRTGEDGWTGADVTDKTEVTDTDVTILERQFEVAKFFDGDPVTGNSKSVVYNNQEHTFKITATNEATDTDTTEPVINYTKDGEDLGSTEPTFEEAGTYVIGYTITKNGYATISDTFTVDVEPATFENVTIGFTSAGVTEDITADIEDGEYEFAYDGSSHEILVTSANTIDGSTVTITYSLDNGGSTSTPPSITDAGVYNITYNINAPNHETISKSITLTITEPVKVVEVLLGETNDYTSGNKMVLVYTDARNVSFKYDGAQMYDVSDGDYLYNGQDEYDYVYALVVDATGVETLASYEEKISVNYNAIGQDFVIDYNNPYDVNSSGDVDSDDIISAFTVLEGADYATMKGIIKLDNNFSKTANTSDITPIIGSIYSN